MTTQRANAIYAIGADRARLMIDLAISTRPKLHRPSVLSFINVLSYIGHRDRIRPKDHNRQYCDDSLDQIADALGFVGVRKSSAVADSIAVATHLEILKTVRVGGKDKPTHRTINLDKLDDLLTVITVSNDVDINGGNRTKLIDGNGNHADSNGGYTATPIPINDDQRTAPLSAAVRVDLTNSDVLNADDFLDALMDFVDGQ